MDKRILVIDDEEGMRRYLQHFLGGLGYSVKTAGTPHEAFDLLKAEKFSVVIADLNMPMMSGTELCRQIRADYPDTVIYAFSGYLGDFESDELERAGFDGYLSKASKKEVLQKALDGAFEQLECQDE
jgi:CheY-like chemotaxis protein